MTNLTLATIEPHWLSTERRTDPWARAWLLWLGELNSKDTRAAYRTAWVQFDQFTGGLHPGAVEHEHVRAWKIVLSERMAEASVNQRLSGISSFYRYINQHFAYLRDDNPADGVKRAPVNPYGKATRLIAGQDQRLLESIDTATVEGKRDYAIILLFLTTAIRLSAVASATPKDVRRQGDVVFFQYRNKGGEDRQVRLPGMVARALRDYLNARRVESERLFGMTRRQIQEMVKRRCNHVFGPGHGITPHSLRHTAAMNLHDDGATIAEIRELLGHKSSRVTLVYLDHMETVNTEKLTDRLAQRYG